MMEMLIFSSNKKSLADRLIRKIVYRLGLKDQLTVCEDINSMESFLRKPRVNPFHFIAILIANNQKDLDCLMCIRGLLKGEQIIFVPLFPGL